MKLKIFFTAAFLVAAFLLSGCQSASHNEGITGAWHFETLGEYPDETISADINIVDGGEMTMTLSSSLGFEENTIHYKWQTEGNKFSYSVAEEEGEGEGESTESEVLNYILAGNTLTFVKDGMVLWKFTRK